MKTRKASNGWKIVYVLALSVCAGVLYWGTVTLARMPEYVWGFWDGREGSVVFVGDVMLSRYVEKHMNEQGADYPFRKVGALFEEYDHIIGNLEGAVPEVHVPTPAMSFSFSINESFLSELSRAGFTLMTLANNHAFDFGVDGYEHTIASLQKHALNVAGHPNRVSKDDIELLDVGTSKVAIIPVHAVPRLADADTVISIIESMSRVSDVQVVSIHWGEEYDLVGNAQERSLAEKFIDAGADAIVGHHPHVVQHIEVYKGAPIFYSLGNFIFDQYWERDVQEGLAVGLTISERTLTYELIPVESVRSMPRVMESGNREQFLKELAQRSDDVFASQIEDGALVFRTPALATSEMAAMMGTY